MDNKPKNKSEILKDFGDDFGSLVKQDIAEIFVVDFTNGSPEQRLM